MVRPIPLRKEDYKSFTLEDYLADDAPFKVGLEFDGRGKGWLAIGLNGKDVYKVKPEYQNSKQQNYALSCRPIMYLDWLNANLDDILTPNPEITQRPGIDFIKHIKDKDIQKYIQISNKHFMIEDQSHYQPLFFLRDNDMIEISWDSSEQGLYFYERGIEKVPTKLFKQRVCEILEFYKETIKSSGFGYSLNSTSSYSTSG